MVLGIVQSFCHKACQFVTKDLSHNLVVQHHVQMYYCKTSINGNRLIGFKAAFLYHFQLSATAPTDNQQSGAIWSLKISSPRVFMIVHDNS